MFNKIVIRSMFLFIGLFCGIILEQNKVTGDQNSSLSLTQNPPPPNCPTESAPVYHDYQSQYDTPPATSCDGTLNLPCKTTCTNAWLASTSSARSTAYNAAQICENTRYNAEMAAYNTYSQSTNVCLNSYISCVPIHGLRYCQDIYCNCIKAPTDTYKAAVATAEATFTSCKASVDSTFNSAVASANVSYTQCVAICCTH